MFEASTYLFTSCSLREVCLFLLNATKQPKKIYLHYLTKKSALGIVISGWTCLRSAFGVGMMLKGGGTVAPVSKYEIQSLVRANFHSVSDFSEMIWKLSTARYSHYFHLFILFTTLLIYHFNIANLSIGTIYFLLNGTPEKTPYSSFKLHLLCYLPT